MRLKALVIALFVAIVVAVIAAAVLLFRPGSERPVRYTVRGIDVSRHQGTIDWARVANARISFAYLKASEGGDWRDPSFALNVTGARGNRIAAGGYHYFTFCAPGGVQARNFLEATEDQATNLPPAVDLEYVGNCGLRPSPEAFASELNAFLRIVEGRTRQVPVLYVTRTFFDTYLTDDAMYGRYPLWIRDLSGTETGRVKRRVLFRQFADNGSVDGVRGLVDEDLFMGSKEEFKALVATGRHD